MEKMQQCPHCGEMILSGVKKCKYCGEWVKQPAEVKNVSHANTFSASIIPDSDWASPEESMDKYPFFKYYFKDVLLFTGKMGRKRFWIYSLFIELIWLICFCIDESLGYVVSIILGIHWLITARRRLADANLKYCFFVLFCYCVISSFLFTIIGGVYDVITILIMFIVWLSLTIFLFSLKSKPRISQFWNQIRIKGGKSFYFPGSMKKVADIESDSGAIFYYKGMDYENYCYVYAEADVFPRNRQTITGIYNWLLAKNNTQVTVNSWQSDTVKKIQGKLSIRHSSLRTYEQTCDIKGNVQLDEGPIYIYMKWCVNKDNDSICALIVHSDISDEENCKTLKTLVSDCADQL